MKTNEEHAKELLALAWCQLDEPLWKARREVEKYLDEHFSPSCPNNGNDWCDEHHSAYPHDRSGRVYL